MIFALFQEVCALIISVAILFITWAFWRWAEIPVTKITQSVDLLEASSSPLVVNRSMVGSMDRAEVFLEIEVSFPVYVLALMSFLGWFFFVIFGGCGMIALPIDLILGYMHRPKEVK